MNELSISPIGINRLDLLLEWRMRVLRDVFADSENVDWEQLREANSQYYLEAIPGGTHVAAMAFVDDEPIGCGGLCLQREMPSPDNASGRCGYLMNIYVLPQWRSQGVAHKIVQWLIDCAHANSAEKIYLESSQCARHMYTSMGFRPMLDMYHL